MDSTQKTGAGPEKNSGRDRAAERGVPPPGDRAVSYEHSLELAETLASLNASLLISTYQAGKLIVVGCQQSRLALSFHNFERPMGVAIDPAFKKLAVAARNKVWLLRNDRDLAAQLGGQTAHPACFLTRSAQVTGEIQAHEMAWAGGELWIVNTLFSCLCTLHPHYSFVPRWRPPFIRSLAPEDRCHLNGLAVQDGKPKFVTAMSDSDSPEGWRPRKTETGCLIDVESGETVARGFAMPHSPRLHLGHVWLLDSGRGTLLAVEPSSGKAHIVACFPGYTRGLALSGDYAVVGLSKIRETSTFDGVPIAENRQRLSKQSRRTTDSKQKKRKKRGRSMPSAGSHRPLALESLEPRVVLSGMPQLIDLNPFGSSSPDDFVEMNGFVYFAADDGMHGRELWRTDGTVAGTSMVVDLNPDSGWDWYSYSYLPKSSNPQNLTAIAGT